MVNPMDMYARTLGLPTPAAPASGASNNMGQLFTLALLRAGKDGCGCDCCRFCQQITDLMVQNLQSPFPSPPPPAAPPGQAPPPSAAAHQPTAPPPPSATAEAALSQPDG